MELRPLRWIGPDDPSERVPPPAVHRTVARLADGRELIYYDSAPPPPRAVADRRDLPPPPAAPQLRYDALVDEWVVVAAHRQARVLLPPADECPLCPSTPDRRTELPSAYEVAVFENRSPSFSRTPATPVTAHLPRLSPVRPAYGRCEVVCFTSDHDASFATLDPRRARLVLDAWTDRTAVLSALDGVEQVFVFENRGVEIGVTLHHPHGQIYAYPVVGPRTRTMLAAARRHAVTTGGRSLFGDVLAAERERGDRVVVANEYWTAFVPAAARWPFEVRLAPHRRVPDLTALTEAERDAFVPVYLDLLGRFDALFGIPVPYVSAWHQAPVRVDRDLAYLHLQLFTIRRARGRLKHLAGAEAAMGMFVNDVAPEQAARLLREADRAA